MLKHVIFDHGELTDLTKAKGRPARLYKSSMTKSGTSQNSDLDFKSKQVAQEALTEGLKQLARNFAAISEGGGTPADLVDEIVNIAECLLLFNEVCGGRPSPEFICEVLTDL